VNTTTGGEVVLQERQRRHHNCVVFRDCRKLHARDRHRNAPFALPAPRPPRILPASSHHRTTEPPYHRTTVPPRHPAPRRRKPRTDSGADARDGLRDGGPIGGASRLARSPAELWRRRCRGTLPFTARAGTGTRHRTRTAARPPLSRADSAVVHHAGAGVSRLHPWWHPARRPAGRWRPRSVWSPPAAASVDDHHTGHSRV
jgi:hypothetical protein